MNISAFFLVTISLTISSGETDGSSYPNGGLRATHRAGGYLSVDPTSHIFLRGDTIFIPGKRYISPSQTC